MAVADTQVAVIGGGVVGCAVGHALARRGVEAVLLEAEPGLALGASGANSGDREEARERWRAFVQASAGL